MTRLDELLSKITGIGAKLTEIQTITEGVPEVLQNIVDDIKRLKDLITQEGGLSEADTITVLNALDNLAGVAQQAGNKVAEQNQALKDVAAIVPEPEPGPTTEPPPPVEGGSTEGGSTEGGAGTEQPS